MWWFPLAILTACLWGVGEIIVRRGMEEISPAWNNVFAAFIAASIWIPFVWRAHPSSLRFAWSDFVLACIIAILYWSYYYGLSKGKLAIASTLMATYPVTSVILSVTILREHIAIHQIIAIVAIVLGIMLTSLAHAKKHQHIEMGWFLWTLACSILFGVAEFLGKVGVIHAGNSFNFLFALALAYIVAGVLNILVDRNGFYNNPLRYPRLFWFLVFGTAAIEVGTIFEFMALGTGPASLIIPLTASSVIITVLGAAIFLKEKLAAMQWLGIVLTIIGVLLVNI